MALARVQGTGRVFATSTTSVALTFAAPPTVGNGIVVLVSLFQAIGPMTTTCADNRGNTYASAATRNTAGVQISSTIHYCSLVGTTGTPFTVTLTITSGTGVYFEAAAVEVSGVGTGLLLDQTATNAGSGTAISTGTTAGLTGTEVLLVAAHAVAANQSTITVATVTPAWTQECENLSYSATIASEGDTRVLTSAAGTTQAATWTDAPGGNFTAVLAAFKAGASGGGSVSRSVAYVG